MVNSSEIMDTQLKNAYVEKITIGPKLWSKQLKWRFLAGQKSGHACIPHFFLDWTTKYLLYACLKNLNNSKDLGVKGLKRRNDLLTIWWFYMGLLQQQTKVLEGESCNIGDSAKGDMPNQNYFR